MKNVIRSKQKTLIFIIIFALAIAVSLIIYAQNQKTHTHIQAITKAAQSKYINTTIYVPTNIPDGYQYKTNSLSNANNITSYILHNQSKDHNLFISIQPIPDDFNFLHFYNQVLESSQEIETNKNEAYMGSFSKNITISIRTDSDWILINAPQNFSITDARLIAEDIHKISN